MLISLRGILLRVDDMVRPDKETLRPRHRSTRPQDEPIFTRPDGLDFEKRSLVVPPGLIRIISGDLSQTTKTASFTAGNETVVLADASDSSITITLPAAATKANKVYYIKKVDNSSNTVTVKGNIPSEEIDGESEQVLTVSKQSIEIIGSGTKVVDSYWHIIGGEYVKMEELLGKILDELKSETEKLKEIDKKLEALE